VIDGYNELVFILRIRIVLTLRDMDSKGCLYPSSQDNLSTDLGCVLRISSSANFLHVHSIKHVWCVTAPNTADGGTRQVCLEEVNRALACEETGGLDNIYEMPEPRSMTSRSATRMGSPLTNLLASTPMMGISLPASTPVMGEQET